jgi:Putative regulator of cell autolysis
MWFGHTGIFTNNIEKFRNNKMVDFGWEWFVISALSVFIFTFLKFVINFKILRADRIKHNITAIVITSIVVTFVFTYLMVFISVYIFRVDLGEYYWGNLFGNMFNNLFLALLVDFISQILYLSYKKQQIALENERLLAENIKSRYQTLKSQVDPHFLFNTLNTLNTMIKMDTDKAQEYVQKMSSVFRYTLQNREETTLEEELKFTKDYCLLMKIRYGDSLIFEFNDDKFYSKHLIVPLSIQTLVENAIKHNVITNRQPLTVSIYTDEKERLIVSNPIRVKKKEEPGEGIGLANLTERYRLHFGQEPEVCCVDNKFKVVLPLIKPRS